MLWVIGGASVVAALNRWSPGPGLSALNTQLHHAEWAGLHALDLVFPLFMFLSGVAIPFALDGKLERGDLTRGSAARRAFVRALVLVALGAVYNGALSSVETPRYAGVLAQIGIAGFFATVAHLWVRGAWLRLLPIALIVVGVSLAQLIHAGGAELTPEGSLNAAIDTLLLPGRLYAGAYDPEGILCVVSATSLTLAGVLTGVTLRRDCEAPALRAAKIGVAGLVCLALGHAAWSAGYPPVKKIWTGTFDLLAAGWSLLIFSAVHWVTDVRKVTGWTMPLRVIGMNSLTAYLAAGIIGFEGAAACLFGRLAAETGAPEAVQAAGVLAVEWGILAWLWSRRIFLRV